MRSLESIQQRRECNLRHYHERKLVEGFLDVRNKKRDMCQWCKNKQILKYESAKTH